MRVPKKNVYRVLSDVKPVSRRATLVSAKKNIISPQKSSDRPVIKTAIAPPPPLPNFDLDRLRRISKSSSSRRLRQPADYSKNSFFTWRLASAFIIGLIVTSGVVYGFSLSNLKSKAEDSLIFVYNQFLETADSLTNFNPTQAKKSLLIANREIKSLKSDLNSLGLAQVSDLLSALIPKFKESYSSFESLEDLTNSAIDASANLEDIKLNGVDYFLNQKGDQLLGLLRGLKIDINSINEASTNIVKNTANSSELISTDNYFSFQNGLYELDDLLSSLITLMDYPKDRHWLILFQNPSEMRATGGFIGSYVDLSISNGSLSAIDVRDVYDSDGQLDTKVVPPEALQAITTNWKTRDANWFFNFPTSAQKITGFLNQSKIYTEASIIFDNTIAINTEVFASLIDIIGPINLPDYNLTLNKDNFLASIQEEVEVNRTKDKNQPKTILKDLTPIVIERLANLNTNDKERLVRVLKYHLDNKDILFYAEDTKLQDFFVKQNIAGQVFPLSATSASNYLAVVNTNIAGGKTDAFINQSIHLKAEIGLNGIVTNFLTVERSHNGHLADNVSWYRTKNQDYMRILTPLNSDLIKVDGATTKKVYPPINYSQAGYTYDSDILTASTDGIEANKTIFSRWLTINPGQTKSIYFEYKNSAKVTLADNQPYQFIFDKQSGVKGGLEVVIEAPPGFKWAENNNFTYTYKADNAPKRLILDLTLSEV